MGNSPSKAATPAPASGGNKSPHSRSHLHSLSHSQSPSHTPPRPRPHRLSSHHYHPHSQDSTGSTSISSTDLLSSKGHTSQTTLSPQTSRSSQSHIRSTSSELAPAIRPRSHTMGNSQSGDASRDKDTRRHREHNQQSSPVQVPPGQRHHGRNRGPSDQIEPSAPPQNDEYAPKSNLHFPPRLPLPIEEEFYYPGSPIISPEDFPTAIHDDEIEGPLPHRTSLLSHTTADDDEDGLEDYNLEGTKGKTVPTTIEWKGHAQKVYITGTFAAWSRKYRMHRNPSNPNILSARLDLPPGTHHVKFIVDGDMQLSNELPTAVDYTNILVNYIEVSADDIPEEDIVASKGLHPPLIVPPEFGVESNDFAKREIDKTPETERPSLIEVKDVHYAQYIPQYLQDLDRIEDSNRFRRGASYVADIPPPPSLPMFLGKSILNGTTPMKDDSSVLNMPNHTVLNHLATSSIKNEVLATSVTTRYKRKYVTTITYKPSNPND